MGGVLRSMGFKYLEITMMVKGMIRMKNGIWV